MDRDALGKLSKDDLIALALAQAESLAQCATQMDGLADRVATLEAKLGLPPKTPDNSSVPPNRGRKPNRAERRAAKAKGRPGSFRALSGTPDHTVTATAAACPHCDHALSPEDQQGWRPAAPSDPGLWPWWRICT